MLDTGTFDPQTRLIQPEVKKLLQEQIVLKKKIAMIERRLEGHLQEMKKFMANNGYKKVEMQGFRMTYSYPKKYYQLRKSKEEVIKEYPEIFEERVGFEKLRIVSAKLEEEVMKELEINTTFFNTSGMVNHLIGKLLPFNIGLFSIYTHKNQICCEKEFRV